jgi:hypothetical protein
LRLTRRSSENFTSSAVTAYLSQNFTPGTQLEAEGLAAVDGAPGGRQRGLDGDEVVGAEGDQRLIDGAVDERWGRRSAERAVSKLRPSEMSRPTTRVVFFCAKAGVAARSGREGGGGEQ